MSEFTRINAARPGKIVDMLNVIDASARSQRAAPEEVAALLQPVYDRLGSRPATAPSAPVEAPPAAPAGAGMDGELIAVLRRLLKRHGGPAVTKALLWTEAHEKLKGE